MICLIIKQHTALCICSLALRAIAPIMVLGAVVLQSVCSRLSLRDLLLTVLVIFQWIQLLRLRSQLADADDLGGLKDALLRSARMQLRCLRSQLADADDLGGLKDALRSALAYRPTGNWTLGFGWCRPQQAIVLSDFTPQKVRGTK